MDSLELLLYILSRIGLLILICVFSAFCGAVVFPSIITLLPSSMNEFKNFIVSTSVQSFIGFVFVASVMLKIFYTDGKKHAAYESWSAVNVSIALICMFMVYFVPSVFKDSFAAEGKGALFYKVFYYPSLWIYNNFDVNFMIAVMIGEALLIAFSFAVYVFSYKIYIKKHPVIYKSVH